MQSVGTRLRTAREEKGFSLEEINARTCITSKNLVAIEHDEVGNISSPFFYRSFVRQYAEQVGIDFQALSQSVELMAGHMRQPDLPGQGEHQPLRVATLQPRPKAEFTWLQPAALFLFVVALGSGGYAAWKHYQPLLHAAALPPVEPTTAVQKQVVYTPQPAEPAAAVKAVQEKIHLELSATEPTWLSVSADGKLAYRGILEPAKIKVLDGQEIARIRTGNAGGVNINFNGKDIGVIGPRGKSRTVVFTKTGFEVQPYSSDLMRANHIGG